MVPGWYGMTNVKWLSRIQVLAEPFGGYQNAVGYRLYDADGHPGEPVTRMLPRSLMVPPGVPDFMTRGPPSRAGTVHVARPRLVGLGAVERVEVQHRRRRDLGRRDPRSPALRRRLAWLVVRVERHRGQPSSSARRATDAAGHTQPLEAPWNLKGYANNAVERLTVECASNHIAADRSG